MSNPYLELQFQFGCWPPAEWVQLERVGERILVYYCRTLIRELDLQSQTANVVRRWYPQSPPAAGAEDANS